MCVSEFYGLCMIRLLYSRLIYPDGSSYVGNATTTTTTGNRSRRSPLTSLPTPSRLVETEPKLELSADIDPSASRDSDVGSSSVLGEGDGPETTAGRGSDSAGEFNIDSFLIKNKRKLDLLEKYGTANSASARNSIETDLDDGSIAGGIAGGGDYELMKCLNAVSSRPTTGFGTVGNSTLSSAR